MLIIKPARPIQLHTISIETLREIQSTIMNTVATWNKEGEYRYNSAKNDLYSLEYPETAELAEELGEEEFILRMAYKELEHRLSLQQVSEFQANKIELECQDGKIQAIQNGDIVLTITTLLQATT